jgi:Lecithin retinol acyltransferase
VRRMESRICDRPRRGLRACDHVLDGGREPPIGAHVVTPRYGFTHHGIYVGRGRVVQYGGLSRGFRLGPVEEVSVMQFAQGRPMSIRAGEFGGRDRPEVVCRARSRLGEDRYHLLTNNCEHLCEWCVRGQHRSYQVDELADRYRRIWQRFLEPLAQMLLRIGRRGYAASQSAIVIRQELRG